MTTILAPSLLPWLRRTLLASVFVCALIILFAAKAEAASISGRVTDINGAPLHEVSFTLYRFVESGSEPPGYWETVSTFDYIDANGNYEVFDFPAGTYRLGIAGQYGMHWEEFYNNQDDIELAEDIVVATDDTELTGYDVVLTHVGHLIVLVVNSDGAPVPNVRVSTSLSETESPSIHWGPTDFGGRTDIYTLSDEPFVVKLDPEVTYLTEYYNDKPDFASADRLVVGGDEVLTITATLNRLKTISATVTDLNNQPVELDFDFDLKIYKQLADSSWDDTLIPQAYSTGPGQFQISSLQPGKYRLEFLGDSIVPEYYQDQVEFEQADIIDLTASPDVTEIDVELTRLGTITGTVTNHLGKPIRGIGVTFYSEDDGEWVYQGGDSTERNGVYEFTKALPDRAYRIHFDGFSYYSKIPYVDEFFNNAATIEAAQTLTVGLDSTLSNINAQLDSHGVITGTVTDLSGTPLAGASVSLYDRATKAFRYSVDANSQGNYSFYLEPGREFAIGFSHATHEAEFYDNKPTIQTSTPVTAPVNTVVPNINAQLTPGTKIVGKITDNNGAALAGITVVAYDSSEQIKATVTTNANGQYAVSLAPGDYRLSFNQSYSEVLNADYTGEYYENAATFGKAKSIPLTFGNDLMIDAELKIVPHISGRVTSSDGNPFSDVAIGLYTRQQVDGNEQWVCCAYTSYPDIHTGEYAIRNIVPGEYKVHFGITNNEFLADEFYPNQFVSENATIFTITDKSVFKNIDAVMEQPGHIRGRVVNAQGEPLAGKSVLVYSEASLSGPASGELDEIKTAADGAFSIYSRGEPYWFEIKDPSHQYADEFYNNQPSIETALPISTDIGKGVTLTIQLDAGAAITGFVTDLAGQPLQGALVSVYRYWPFGDEPWQLKSHSTHTNAAGYYHLDNLTPNAQYRLRFAWQDQKTLQWTEAYYPGAATVENAQTLVVPTPTTLPNINMSLLKPGNVKADFTAAPRDGTGSLTVNFTDQSIGAITSRSWDFGDGITSTQINPTHTYTTSGAYTVTLTVNGAAGNDVETKASYITLADTPITEVTIQGGNAGGAPQNNPKVGETIYFSATAAGSNVQFLWDFGDDNVSAATTATGPSVQHSYAAPGEYTVTLTARNSEGEEQVTRQIVVKYGLRLPSVTRE